MLFEKYFLTESLSKRFHDKIKKSTALGTDGVLPEHFSNILDEEIELIQRKVKNMTYRFSRFNEKLILKNKKSPPRAVYIPTVRDRLVFNVLNSYLSEAFSEDLKPYQLTVSKNISEIIQILDSENFNAFIKLDVKNFFPSLDHDILLSKLKNRIQDKAALSLLKKALNRSKLDMDSESGIAQGLSISGKLAEIYLNDLDKILKHRPNFKYFRFVDDILILCNQTEAAAIQSEIQQQTIDLKLELHTVQVGGKSEVGTLYQDKLEYLGFSFKDKQISVRENTVERLRKRIRQEVLEIYNNKENNRELTSEDYRKLNLKITGCLYDKKSYGWLFFFKDINNLALLHHLDWFVKKTFDSFEMDYEPKEIKSFVKAYFKIKSLNPNKLDENTYIPSFKTEISLCDINVSALVIAINEAVEKNQKKKVDSEAIKKISINKIVKDLKPNISKVISLEEMILELEKDIEIY